MFTGKGFEGKAKCLICNKPMATVRDKPTCKGADENTPYDLYYSCKNKRCIDYGELYVRDGFPKSFW